MRFIERKKHGFTLVEVAIGLAIGSMLIGGVYLMVVSSLRNTSKNEVRQTSALFTQQLMEELKGSTVIVDENYNVTGFENLDGISREGANWEKQEGEYKAKIEIKKNPVTIGEKESNGSDEDKSFCTELEINDDFTIDDKSLIDDSDQVTDPVVINIVALINEDDKFEVSFRDKSNKELKTITSEKRNKKNIMLNLNFEKCIINKDLHVNVFNRTNKEFLLTVFKGENISIQVNSKVGQLSFLDNQTSNTKQFAQLYDITITIKPDRMKENEDPLITKSSQNLNINVDTAGD